MCNIVLHDIFGVFLLERKPTVFIRFPEESISPPNPNDFDNLLFIIVYRPHPAVSISHTSWEHNSQNITS